MTTQFRNLSRLFVANRGEIARRIFRTAQNMGLPCAAAYVGADEEAPYVSEADIAVPLDPGGYLNAQALIGAALATGSDAVHPGYGFLAESAAFATAVEAAGLIWVGPTPEVIASMGDKISAKKAAMAAGVPTLTSTTDPTAGDSVGYPLLVKAAAGGGGKGMHLVIRPEDLVEAVATAQREAYSSFGDDRVFLERCLPRSRHIEIQILGDVHGSLIHLGERECSIQRRHQKVIEESPAVSLDNETRDAMGAAAISLSSQIGYHSAGTVEFLLDDDTGEFFFLEINTRLQVEHPVTEEITGIDLVREQLRIAAGEPLGFDQDDVIADGHAIEVRLYAEDPSAGYLPSTGTVEAWRPPVEPSVRWDSGVEEGTVVGVDFDPMLAKVVAHGPTRREAAARLALALERLHLGGVKTNRDLLAATLRHEGFLAGDTTTDFLDRYSPESQSGLNERDARWVAAAAALWLQGRNRDEAQVLGRIPSGWRNARLPDQKVTLKAKEGLHDVRYRLEREGHFTVNVGDTDSILAKIHSWSPGSIDATINGIRRTVPITAVAALPLEDQGEVVHLTAAGTTSPLEVMPRFSPPRSTSPTGGLIAPMPGRVLEIRTSVGGTVVAGQSLLVLEAMKMEHHMTAPVDGTVIEIRVVTGDQVDNGALLLVIEPVAEEGGVDG